MLLSKYFLLSVGALFCSSHCMEIPEKELSDECLNSTKLGSFNMAMMEVIAFDQPGSLAAATTLVEDEYIRQNYRTVINPHLFQTCLGKIIKEKSCPRHLLEAMSILLRCEGLPVSWLDAGKVFMATHRMPKELYEKLLAIVPPTDEFMTELVKITQSRGNELDVQRLVAFMTWSYRKVSNETWIDLLNGQIPTSVYGSTQLLHAFLPYLVRDTVDLKDKIKTADNTFCFEARKFLEPILKTINVFMFMTQEGRDQDFWLPEEVVTHILSMHTQLFLYNK